MSDTATLDPPASADRADAERPPAAGSPEAGHEPETPEPETCVIHGRTHRVPTHVPEPPAVSQREFYDCDPDGPFPRVRVTLDGQLARFLGAHVEGVDLSARLDEAVREYVEANPRLKVLDLFGAVEFEPEFLEEMDRRMGVTR